MSQRCQCFRPHLELCVFGNGRRATAQGYQPLAHCACALRMSLPSGSLSARPQTLTALRSEGPLSARPQTLTALRQATLLNAFRTRLRAYLVDADALALGVILARAQRVSLGAVGGIQLRIYFEGTGGQIGSFSPAVYVSHCRFQPSSSVGGAVRSCAPVSSCCLLQVECVLYRYHVGVNDG